MGFIYDSAKTARVSTGQHGIQWQGESGLQPNPLAILQQLEGSHGGGMACFSFFPTVSLRMFHLFYAIEYQLAYQGTRARRGSKILNMVNKPVTRKPQFAKGHCFLLTPYNVPLKCLFFLWMIVLGGVERGRGKQGYMALRLTYKGVSSVATLHWESTALPGMWKICRVLEEREGCVCSIWSASGYD